jgi:hypothetical protein
MEHTTRYCNTRLQNPQLSAARHLGLRETGEAEKRGERKGEKLKSREIVSFLERK